MDPLPELGYDPLPTTMIAHKRAPKLCPIATSERLVDLVRFFLDGIEKRRFEAAEGLKTIR